MCHDSPSVIHSFENGVSFFVGLPPHTIDDVPLRNCAGNEVFSPGI